MEKQKALDYLLIPTGWKKQRKKRALKEIKKRKIKNIFILNGKNSEEDILDLGKILKGKERIGIVTFPLHFREYELIIKKAQKQKKFSKEIILENIETKETIKQFIYGILGLLDEELIEGKVDYVENKPKNYFIFKLRKFIKNCLA
ncbi:MAG: hypothetical protein PVJ67_06295 [Candidatus Pacearchaeota archaeon]